MYTATDFSIFYPQYFTLEGTIIKNEKCTRVVELFCKLVKCFPEGYVSKHSTVEVFSNFVVSEDFYLLF